MEDTLRIGTNASVPNSADGDPSDPESSTEGGTFELSDIDSFEELFTRLETDLHSDNDLAETLANRLTWVEADLSADGSNRRITDPATKSLGLSSERRPRMSDVQDRIETLENRLEAIEDNLTDEQEHTGFQDEFLEAVAGQLNQIDARIDELASETKASRELLADRVDEAESDIDDLAAEIETVDQSLSSEHESVADRLDDIESSVDGQHRQLANEQQRLRSRIDAEFGDLETILEHLVTQADSHDDDLSRLRAERDALRSLLSEAAEQGVDAGECEVCGKQISLGLLADPYCSECDSLLTGVKERSKWLFFSKVVITAEDDRIGTSSGSAPQDPVPERRGTETRPTRRSPSRADERDPASHPTDSGADPAGDDTAADDTAESAPESGFHFNNPEAELIT
jgi:flagellar biosynthesis chaperone FliJ